MPAPDASVIKSQIMALLPPSDFPKPPEDMLSALSSGWAKGWASWQDGIKGGKNKVIGAGIGAWSGVGLGGKLTEGSRIEFTIDVADRSPEFTDFETALVKAIAEAFSGWASSYTFLSVQYIGTSGVLPPAPPALPAGAPGSISVKSIPIPLIAAGMGTPPAQIKDPVSSELSGKGWKLDHEACKTGVLLQAIEGALPLLFMTWLGTTMFSANSANGGGTPPAGMASLTSQNDGKLI